MDIDENLDEDLDKLLQHIKAGQSQNMTDQTGMNRIIVTFDYY